MSAKELASEQAARLIAGINIPPQPQMLIELMELINTAEPDLNKIAGIISSDVGLSAAILKTINSPFFGVNNEVTSIKQAAMLLGLNNVINLVRGLSLRKAIQNNSKIDLNIFWEVATDTALCCASISRQLSIATPDEAYTLGLFHDCGIPLLMQKFSDYDRKINEAMANMNVTLTTIEEQAYKTNHAVVGYYVAKTWRLPEKIRDVILEHHNYALLNNDESPIRNIIALLTVARHIAHQHTHTATDPEWESYEDVIRHCLLMEQDDFDEMKLDLREMLEEK